MDSTTQVSTPAHVGDIVRIPSGSEATVESIDLASNTAVCAWKGTRSTFALVDLVWVRPGLRAGDVVQLPSGTEAQPTLGTIGAVADGYADVIWFNAAGEHREAKFAVADLERVPDSTADSTAAIQSPADATADANTASKEPSVAARVKEFWQHAEEDVKAAFHGEILSKIDELGPGSSVSRDEFHTAVTAWRNGTRIHGHGATTAEALADFHRQAGPAA